MQDTRVRNWNKKGQADQPHEEPHEETTRFHTNSLKVQHPLHSLVCFSFEYLSLNGKS